MNLAPRSAASSSIYVHLTSGSVDQLSPANDVHVGLETIDILNDGHEVAHYTARDVLFCSHLDVSPFPCS
jgi:hypothetical protein